VPSHTAGMSMVRDPVGWWCSLGRPLRRLSRGQAIGLLLALVLALGWASYAATSLAATDAERVASMSGDQIGDIELYLRVHERYQEGENYYQAAMSEQRQNNYPTIPFVTVRLPTLAVLDSMVSDTAWTPIALLLLIAMILGWIGALAPLATRAENFAAAVILFVSTAGLFDPRALLWHELVAGALLTVAMGVYRENRWWPSLLLAAAALAVRELALPFILLWGAFALSRRSWKEAAAIAALLLVFAVGMWLHAQGVAAHRLPDDLVSPGWDAFSGPQLAILALAKLTPLLFLPVGIAAPIALIALLGWIGLGGRLGLFASLWFIGFCLAVSIFARTNNFYWVMLLLPAYAAGLALVPRALLDLLQIAKGTKTSQS